MTFLLLFNDLKFGKSSLFCCNGYRHAIFIFFFYESQVEYLRKAFTKENFFKKVLMNFIAVLLHFYGLNYLNLTKSWLSNQRRISWLCGLRGIGLKVIGIKNIIR